jgi:predicted MFS family arabinose efflux permease
MRQLTRPREIAVVALMFCAMSAATVAAGVLGVLATFIIDDLGISRGTLGWLLSSFVLVGAILSPFAGSLADRLGGKKAVVVLFVASAAAFAVFGLAPGLFVMFVASAVGALSQASANPATNTLLGQTIPRGRRGIITGIKQSGVQAGVALAGITLPAIAIAFGWRAAMLIVAAGVLVAGVAAIVVVPPTARDGGPSTGWRGTLPPSTPWLAAYGAVFGFAGSVTLFVPLFAEEALGLDPRVAGAVVSVVGVVALMARIAWARYAEIHHRFRWPLGVMAVLGAAAGFLFLGASAAPVLLLPAAILTGMGTSAWNSVGMLAIIDEAGDATGRASGVVQLGFLVGLGTGPALFGATVDAVGGYWPVWWLSIGASVVSLAIVGAWSRFERHRTPVPAAAPVP